MTGDGVHELVCECPEEEKRVAQKDYLWWRRTLGPFYSGFFDENNYPKSNFRKIMHIHVTDSLIARYKGVKFDKNCDRRPYYAQIKEKGKCRSLGYFATAKEAALAYARAKDIKELKRIEELMESAEKKRRELVKKIQEIDFGSDSSSDDSDSDSDSEAGSSEGGKIEHDFSDAD